MDKTRVISSKDNPPSPVLYCRTLDSMLIEWDAHNDLKWIKPNESRLASVDFDKNSETLGYWDYYKLAVEEQLKIWLN